MKVQGALDIVYPPQCLTCDAFIAADSGLCATCWRDTPFITGLVCDKCGTPLPGDPLETGAICDDCTHVARPWDRGRAATLYRDNARRMILALKHGDRMELAAPFAHWLLRSARPILTPDLLVVPVPLHWWRLIKRKYNQSALISAAFARATGLAHCPDALLRRHGLVTQEGRDRDARFANVRGAFAVNPRRAARIAGQHVLLIDDVMTSGATLAAAAEACKAGGASEVSVLCLARVAKDA